MASSSEESDLSMEYVGNMYFNTLFLNSLLQDAEKDDYDSITSCKMHDVVHDLALNKADNYCSTLEASQLNGDSDAVHLSLISSLRVIPKNSFCSRLHTLIVEGDLDGKLLANFKCLRVLVISHDGIKKLPDSIAKLKHLRYLDISKTWILSLPNSITKLYHLQTLRLGWLHGIPKNFGHLCIEVSGPSMHCLLIGTGWLTYLQTLPFFVMNRDKGCHIEELGSLDNLRGNLTIFGLEDVENSGEAKHENLSRKSHLCTLTLSWGHHSYRSKYAYWDTPLLLWQMPMMEMPFRKDERSKNKVYNDEDVLEGPEPHSNLEGLTIEHRGKFPLWMMVESQPSSVLRNLVKFKLENCNECVRIPPLGHLRHLKVVEIIGMDNLKVIGTEFYGKHTAGDGGASSSSGAVEVPIFPALRELTLEKMPKLERWLETVQQSRGSMNVFSYLEKLKIEGCSNLITVPSHFPSITDLRISSMDNSLALKEMNRKLTSLNSLSLVDIKGPEFQFVAEEFLGSNKSLRKLSIFYCDAFSYFPNNVETLVSNLFMSFCPNLSSLGNNLMALERLRLHYCNNLIDLPRLPSVKEVSISGCEKLIGIPSLTQIFPAIEKLTIRDCHNMMTFPDMHSAILLYRNFILEVGKI